MTDTIKFLYGRKAKNFVRRRFTSTRDMLVEQWLYEESSRSVAMCYLTSDDRGICSVTLLRKMDFDPLRIQEKPWLINYIFTKPEHQRKGYGQKLASTISELMQVSAHCSSIESMEMFLKAGYKPHSGVIHNESNFTFLVRSE